MGLSLINKLRKEKGIGIDELSALSGVPKGTLSKITAGITQNPNFDTVQAIARALGCSTDVFDDYPRPEKLTISEREHIEKFRALDEYGKKSVNAILDIEYQRLVESNKRIAYVPLPDGSSVPANTPELIERKRKLDSDIAQAVAEAEAESRGFGKGIG